MVQMYNQCICIVWEWERERERRRRRRRQTDRHGDGDTGRHRQRETQTQSLRQTESLSHRGESQTKRLGRLKEIDWDSEIDWLGEIERDRNWECSAIMAILATPITSLNAKLTSTVQVSYHSVWRLSAQTGWHYPDAWCWPRDPCLPEPSPEEPSEQPQISTENTP